MIKVSVIVPVYNMEAYLEQCIKSILMQDLKEIEIICINDGSTDSSLQILKKYGEKDTRVRVIDQKNQGVGRTRNKGIELAKGEFVAFMDPDDYYNDEKILTDVYRSAKEQNVKISGGSFSEDHGTWIRTKFEGIYQKYTFNEDKLLEYSDYQFDYGYHRFIYNRNLLLENNIVFPPYIRFQDPPFFVKAMIAAREFYALKRVTYCYRWGHQKLNWDIQRSTDVLKGLKDNLSMAEESGLAELRQLTLWRIQEEYKKVFINAFISDNNETFLNEFFENHRNIRSNYKETLVSETIETLKKNLTCKKKELEEEHKKLQAVYESTTWKVGSKVLCVPKKIKKLWNNILRGKN